jgi:hypothetical protein
MAEGLSCSLEVLYGGLGISELQFLIKEEKKKISAFFSSIFGHQNSGSISESGTGSIYKFATGSVSRSISGFTYNAGFGFVSGSTTLIS